MMHVDRSLVYGLSKSPWLNGTFFSINTPTFTIFLHFKHFSIKVVSKSKFMLQNQIKNSNFFEIWQASFLFFGLLLKTFSWTNHGGPCKNFSCASSFSFFIFFLPFDFFPIYERTFFGCRPAFSKPFRLQVVLCHRHSLYIVFIVFSILQGQHSFLGQACSLNIFEFGTFFVD